MTLCSPSLARGNVHRPTSRKVAHVITRLIIGGAQENTIFTAEGLQNDYDYDVTLVTGPPLGPEGGLLDGEWRKTVRCTVLPQLRRAVNPVRDAISFAQLYLIFRKEKYDIVHTHSSKAGILGRLAARLARVPIVVHTIHGLPFHPYQSKWLNRFYIAVEKAAAKRTDFFISVADAMTAQATAAGIGQPEQFCTAYSAIEEEDFLQPIPQQQKEDFRRKYEIAEDAVVLVTIARLFMLKGHKYIIESAKELSRQFDKAVWLFVGDGNLSDHFKNQVRQLGLAQKIKFTGLLPPSKIPLVIQSSDILVHCSLREGLARTLPQAMLCGKPAISFDIDGEREVVNETTGRLIEPQNIEQLTTACAELIENEKLRKKLGQQGRDSVKEKFAPEKMVDTIEGLYLKLLP